MIQNGNGFNNGNFRFMLDKDRLSELRQCVNQLRERLDAVDDEVKMLIVACSDALEANDVSELEHLCSLLWQKFLALGEICATLAESSDEGMRLQEELKHIRNYIEGRMKNLIAA